MTDDLALQIVLVVAGGVAAQWAAWQFHTPAILFLLALGAVFGPATGLLDPGLLMGDLFRPFIASAVAVILFEGSLQLRFRELRETRRAVRQIIFLGAPIGWVLISCAGHFIAGLEWPVAVTLGGILVVTGPTVIMPLLRQARLTPRIGAILKWEGIVNDPLGVIFAILSYEYFVAVREQHAGTFFFLGHGLTLVIIILVSFLLAHAIKRIFERGYMPQYLKTPFLVCIVLLLFFGCNAALHESGLIAVTILGLTLANIHTAGMESIKRFKETITIMLVSSVFILLTADLDFAVLLNLGWRDILFVCALLFLVRPVTIALCGIGTHMTRQDVLLTGLIAPRGVVCAAMAGVLGPLLTESGFEDGSRILPLAFAVVVVSIVLHSLMIKPLARRLNLTSNEINGVLIAGAWPWSIQLAETLKSRNIPVMLVDNDWDALGKARLNDIPVYYGELLSEETEFALEFNKYNTLIAAMANPAYNALLCEKFAHDYGTERVFQISADDSDIPERRKIPSAMQGRLFVSESFSLFFLRKRFQEGWRFRTTRIGRQDKDSPLIVPEETESRTLVGIVSKSGIVSLHSNARGLRPTPKEDDIAILWEKE